MPHYGMVIDLKRCYGCYACVMACKVKNHTPPGVFWARVLKDEVGTYPNTLRQALPVLCMQCDEPSCMEVCPTGVFTDKSLVHDYTRKWDLQSAPSVCVGCAVGCNILPGERYGRLKRIHNRFNAEVRPFLTEIPIGRQGIGFDRLDLDAWVDQYKSRNGRPGQSLGERLWDEKERRGSLIEPGSGISTNKFGEAAFAKALARATSGKRKPILRGASNSCGKQGSTE